MNKCQLKFLVDVGVSSMVLTMDKDFGELVCNSGLPHAGVLLLRAVRVLEQAHNR